MAEAASGRRAAANRPLSPHLQIYAPLINMVMSILHRITGTALYFGTLLLALWLAAAAAGPPAFSLASDLCGSLIGRVILLGYSWALMHHALGGARHLVWDTGRGLTITAVNRLSWLTIIGSLALTAALWSIGLRLGGGI